MWIIFQQKIHIRSYYVCVKSTQLKVSVNCIFANKYFVEAWLYFEDFNHFICNVI